MASGAPWAEVERLASPPHAASGRLLGPRTVSVARPFREALADLHAMAAALAWCDGAVDLPAAVAGPCGARLERRETAAEVVFASSGAAPAERVVRIPRSTLQRLGR
jgi:hypothetical protein